MVASPIPGWTYDVFLSYSSKNREQVVKLAERLKGDGIRVWLDVSDIVPGGNILMNVIAGVQGSQHLIQVFSPSGLGSEWAEAERDCVLIDDPGNKLNRFVPLLFEDVTIPPYLKRFRYIDFRTNYENGYRELLTFLRHRKVDDEESRPLYGSQTAIGRQTTGIVFEGGDAPLGGLQLHGRESELREIKHLILAGARDAGSAITAIHGWPGVGKTSLAANVAHDPDVRQAYSQGLLWATVGDNPDIQEILRLWAIACGIKVPYQASIHELQVELRQLASQEPMLVVLDDVWTPISSELILGGPGHTLVTTRAPSIARFFAETEKSTLKIGVLSPSGAFELLRSIIPSVATAHKLECEELLARAEYLPLAIKVVAGLLQSQMSVAQTNELKWLFDEMHRMESLLSEAPPRDIPFAIGSSSLSVAALLAASVDKLDTNTKRHFLNLSVMAPAPAVFNARHASATTVLRGAPLMKLLASLSDHGLIEKVPKEQYWIHSLLVATARWLLQATS